MLPEEMAALRIGDSLLCRCGDDHAGGLGIVEVDAVRLMRFYIAIVEAGDSTASLAPGGVHHIKYFWAARGDVQQAVAGGDSADIHGACSVISKLEAHTVQPGSINGKRAAVFDPVMG